MLFVGFVSTLITYYGLTQLMVSGWVSQDSNYYTTDCKNSPDNLPSFPETDTVQMQCGRLFVSIFSL